MWHKTVNEFKFKVLSIPSLQTGTWGHLQLCLWGLDCKFWRQLKSFSCPVPSIIQCNHFNTLITNRWSCTVQPEPLCSCWGTGKAHYNILKTDLLLLLLPVGQRSPPQSSWLQLGARMHRHAASVSECWSNLSPQNLPEPGRLGSLHTTQSRRLERAAGGGCVWLRGPGLGGVAAGTLLSLAPLMVRLWRGL